MIGHLRKRIRLLVTNLIMDRPNMSIVDSLTPRFNSGAHPLPQLHHVNSIIRRICTIPCRPPAHPAAGHLTRNASYLTTTPSCQLRHQTALHDLMCAVGAVAVSNPSSRPQCSVKIPLLDAEANRQRKP